MNIKKRLPEQNIENLYSHIRNIIEEARNKVYRTAKLLWYMHIGR